MGGADNLDRIQQSYSVAFADFVRKSEAAGRKVVKMQTGDPDFVTHPNIVSAAHEAMLRGETKYCDSRGLMILREAVAQKLAKENNIITSANDSILVTHGAVHGISVVIRALVNAGDECIIVEPFWRAYEANIILCGGVPVIAPASSENGFMLDADLVLAQITNRTKLIIINSPNNPSGAVYDKDELRKLATGAAERGVYLISDEVYEAIIFDGKKHYSPASDPRIFDWVISVFSFSKTFSMTGWRVGYIVACPRLIDEVLKLSQFSVTSIAPFNQIGAAAALSDTAVTANVRAMSLVYEKRRDAIFEMISGSWLEAKMTHPKGTFYILIDTAQYKSSSLDLAQKIVDRSGIALTPGIAFGSSMDSYLRMCFATSDSNIEQAVRALIEFDKEY